MRLNHNRLHRHRQLLRDRNQEIASESAPGTQEFDFAEHPVKGVHGDERTTLENSSSHSSVKIGDDYSLDLSDASSILQCSTGSGFSSQEPSYNEPRSAGEESTRKNHSVSKNEFCNLENSPNRSNHKNEKYRRKEEDARQPLPSQMSYGEWKKQQIARQRSSSPVRSISGQTVVRTRYQAYTRHHQSPDLSGRVAHSSLAYSDSFDPRKQEYEPSYQDHYLPVVTPPRSVVSQASVTSISSHVTARIMNTSYFSGDDDVLVRVGNKEFRHSRAILSYASKVLAKYVDKQDGSDELHIPHKLPSEWQELQAFLQPRSVQAASITPSNLPALLPWFEQLELTVLVRECDSLLSSLRFATAIPDDADNAVSNAVHEIARATLGIRLQRNPQQHTVPPCYHDVVDIMLLTRITGKVCLPRTREMCLGVLQEYLDLPHLFLQWEGKDNVPAMSLLTPLIELLEDDKVFDTLWPSLISYLPEDLPVSDDRRELIHNPLFPFLLRAGLEKACYESDDYSESLLMGNGYSRATSRKTAAFVHDQSVEVSFLGERYVSAAGEESLPNDKESDHVDPTESLQYSFETWNEVSSISARTSKKTRWKEGRLPAFDIQDRTLWLNTIWRKLLEPPIFPPMSSEDDPSERIMPRESEEIRTFFC